MMEILKDVSAVLGLFIAIGTVLCVTIPGIRNKILEWANHTQANENLAQENKALLKKIDETQQMLESHIAEGRADIECLKDSQRSVLRDRITAIYYKNLENQTLHTYEMENLAHLHESYKALGGNTFEGAIYTQMTTEWKVVS